MSSAEPRQSRDLSAFRRPPSVVMRLARMGSAHPTRLSFLRVLLRRLKAEKWRFDRPVWEIDAKGVGRAVYRAIGPQRTYSLVAFAHDLPDEMRSDRVIATAWDATFTLFDGDPSAADLDRLQANVPLQEAGRISPRELSLSRANRSVRLDPDLKRGLGVGNSTGLGMAPFLVRHPVLLHNWMAAREEALARVRAQEAASSEAIAGVRAALAAARDNAALWRSEHPIQVARLADLRRDLDRIGAHLSGWPGAGPHPWDALWRWGAGALSLEGQEALVALMLEPYGALIDDLAATMSADEVSAFRIDGAMTIGALGEILRDRYGWAQRLDFSRPDASARFWYVSEEKLEPRLGDRYEEPGAELEQPLCIARLVCELAAALDGWDTKAPLAGFLLAHPEHRYMVRRAQIARTHAFAEVQDNLIAADMLPIDLMRCKLAFFGASRFDPRSDRWVRISLFQDECYPSDLAAEDAR